MVTREEVRKYLPDDEVFFQTDTYYSKTRITDTGFEVTYNGLGKYQGEAPRRIYIPFCNVSTILEKDGVIVIETGMGEYELRKAYTVEEMKGTKKSEEKSTFSLTELLEL